MNAPALRVGRCPSVFRPMMTGDGLIARVKPRGGVLTLDQAEAVGVLARECGNGLIDLTGRANLQLRGIRPDALDHLSETLIGLDLAAADAAAEAIRNIVSSPLAGLDPEAKVDIRPIVTALDQVLATDPRLQRLHPKWSIVVDDGGSLPLTAVAADIRFEAADDGAILVGLADDPVRVRTQTEHAGSVLVNLARLTLASGEPRRMADLVREKGAPTIRAVGLTPADTPPARPSPSPESLLGPHALPFSRANGRRWPSRQRGSDEGNLESQSPSTRPTHPSIFGIAAPFGSFTANQWSALVAAARTADAADLRLTPWRVVLAIGLRQDQTAHFDAAISAAGLITDGNDPRLAVSACTGAPACHRASTPTRSDAQDLLALLGAGSATRPKGLDDNHAPHPEQPPEAACRRTHDGGACFDTPAARAAQHEGGGEQADWPSTLAPGLLHSAGTTPPPIHISGCSKGCGVPQTAAWTLVAQDGAYDLVRSGSVHDTPAVIRLSLHEAAAWISRDQGGTFP